MICPECEARWGDGVNDVGSSALAECAAHRPEAAVAFDDLRRALNTCFPERAAKTIALLETVFHLARQSETTRLAQRTTEAKRILGEALEMGNERDEYIQGLNEAANKAFNVLDGLVSNSMLQGMHAVVVAAAQPVDLPGMRQLFERAMIGLIGVDMGSHEMRALAQSLRHIDFIAPFCECGHRRQAHRWGDDGVEGRCAGNTVDGVPCARGCRGFQFPASAHTVPVGVPSPAAHPALFEAVPITSETPLNAVVVSPVNVALPWAPPFCWTCGRDLSGHARVQGGTMPHLPEGVIQCRGCARSEVIACAEAWHRIPWVTDGAVAAIPGRCPTCAQTWKRPVTVQRPIPPDDSICPSCRRLGTSLHGYGWECRHPDCSQRPWGRD